MTIDSIEVYPDAERLGSYCVDIKPCPTGETYGDVHDECFRVSELIKQAILIRYPLSKWS